jgi:hypothetical protein
MRFIRRRNQMSEEFRAERAPLLKRYPRRSVCPTLNWGEALGRGSRS